MLSQTSEHAIRARLYIAAQARHPPIRMPTAAKVPGRPRQTSEPSTRPRMYLTQQAEGEPGPAERIARTPGAPGNWLGKTLQLRAPLAQVVARSNQRPR